MHCVCNMDGSQTTPLRHAAVEVYSLLITPWSALAWVASQLFIIMRFMTSPPHFSLTHNIATEPPLQLLSRKSVTTRSANTDDVAHLDIHARGFWNMSHTRCIFRYSIFLPERVHQPLIETSSVYRSHEQAKKQEYEQHITKAAWTWNIHPLVLSSTSGSGREVTTFTNLCLAGIFYLRKGNIPTQ